MIRTALALISILICTPSYAKTIYTLQAAFDGVTEDSYEYQALSLALEKTVDEFGTYQLKVTSEAVPPSRYMVEANSGNYENFIFANSVKKESLHNFSHANFPVLLGIIGYRVPLISKDLKARGYSISSRNELMTFSMIQGKGWLDTDILKDNGFKVHTGKYIEGLFHMVANERGNFFPIGASQINGALTNFSHVEGLTIDEKILLYYPLPRFFFMGTEHQNKIYRIEKGLITAYEDGSLQRLWQQHFNQALVSVGISKRKLFKLRNKYIDGIDNSYEKYVFDPFAKH
ncbi:hypothetical protein [Catenovulum maritimum]|uniref:hypothetical protein n=1 Tax=Catenovulum maritimum TaxID=1513271 RepID=UPI00122DEDFA|nr:hypothetical protein [Catenovulum maritimum]